jgi:MFS family permease
MSTASPVSADSPALRQSKRAERFLVPATFITTAGNSFQLTAATVLVFRAGHTALSVGWLFIAVSIPQVVFSLAFGRLVDRLDRRMLSILSDAVSAVSALALPVWLWLHGPATLGSYLTNFVLAVTAALFMPASNALVKERVLDARLDRFNSHFEMANNAGMLLASSAAGFLTSAFGATPLLVFNSGTFVASAVLTWFIGPKLSEADAAGESGADTDEDAQARTGAAPGPARPAAGPPIKRLAVLYANWSLGLLVANTLLTTVIFENFHKGPWLIGVSDALAGVGFLTGAACYPWFSKRVKGLRLAAGGMAVMLVLFCLQPINYIVLMAVIPVAGFFFAQGRISSRTLLMRASPTERVGRIFGGTNAAGLAAGITANLVISTYADHNSLRSAFWVLAAVQAAILASTYLNLVKPMAALEEPAAPVRGPEPEPAPASA